ncbi:MurR/RpiR family transcriptional regulator [Pseudorhodoferax sp. Leaf265]|jgi:DNA-binding MurR/RpiR family transcriptional regulator|uniref:MurR/RpiR family transcriptional regulator n=1 Tax=Pseudorhodoferax sp. Leaf265 TaxID=1736315 RepID=UPI0006FE18A6|nr:MurR/RpiR family transcriptional regulator [Pseudorhodoferax sp. Leaf265]KQP15933.1 RpiR family transcriptional regulator [Pseudorhodoferax sp. Leaf265]PZQ01467.1 MAG: MurR/RpiR family transcriptional regulator [Variovorax paradoxus]PZQ14546.1 MAG: MurR/RpiR family transcriptional regulator [Variovorax paradoxus]
MNTTPSLLERIALAREAAPATRRAILQAMLEDPDRTLEESFEQLAERSGSSVPTIMRTCRDLGFAGLREFKLALAQELALGGSPLHRRVNIADAADEVVGKIARSAAASVAGVRNQLDMAVLQAAVDAIAGATHIDIVGAGNTSWFMATDLQARLFRLGLSATAWADYHLQQVAAGAQKAGGVVIAITHVGGMPSLLDAVDIARAQGAKVVAITRPGTPLAARADWLLGLTVPDDAVMHVGIDAYLVHLTLIEVLTVLVAQRVGEPAVRRLRGVREALQRHGVDVRTHPLQSWDGDGVQRG